METTSSTTATSTTATAENKKGVKLVFRIGEKKDLISKYEGKIAIIDRALKDAPETGISYTCELKPMLKGNGWIVMAFEKTPATKASLVFKKGKRMYNEKTDTYKENMVSSFDGEIVISPEEMILDAGKSYECELVLSPSGRAYIVEKAELAMPAVANIIADESSFCVQVEIGGVLQADLKFNPATDDGRDLLWKIAKLDAKSIVDKDMVVSNYEATCEDMLVKYKNK